MDTYETLLSYGLHGVRIIALFLIWWLGGAYLKGKAKQALIRLKFDKLRANFVVHFFSYLLTFIVLVAVLYELGVNISALLGVAGVIGVAVGFASRASFANIISGLFLMLERPFELGDSIVFNAFEGEVTAVNLFAIILKSNDGNIIRIPHEQLIKGTVIKKVAR